MVAGAKVLDGDVGVRRGRRLCQGTCMRGIGGAKTFLNGYRKVLRGL